MKIIIFGANGPTGQQLTRQAIAKGHFVTAFTRHPETFPIQDVRLKVLQGDVFDSVAVEHAVAGQDAVLSSLGVPFTRKSITVYSKGMAHIVRAMNRNHVSRMVCVSSSATEPHYDPKGGFIFERIVQPMIIRTIGRTTYDDMRQMESLVKNSNLDWTIVRPSGLFETPAVTNYHVEEIYIRGRFTSRADLANCMLEQLTDDRYLKKVIAVATVEVQPSMLKLIMKEAFKK